MMGKVPQVTRPCRLRPEELVAYQDGTLPLGRREIVEAHLTACPHCQGRLATFREVDDIIRTHAIPVEGFGQRRAELRARLHREDNRQRSSALLRRLLSPHRPVVLRLLVALFVVLTAVPTAAQAGFPIGDFVRFAKVEIKEALPLDEQGPIRHVAPSDSAGARPSFQPVAPTELPLGLARVEQSVPDADRVELLYRDQAGLALLVTQLPADTGMVTLERTETDLVTVQGTDILIVREPRPNAVASFIWERDGVFFDVMVIEAPTGKYGGLKRADALQVVAALMAAQDAGQE